MLWPYALLWLAVGVALIAIGLIDLMVQWIEDNTPFRTFLSLPSLACLLDY